MFKKKYQQTTKKENLDTENLSNDIFLSQIKAKSKLKNQLARCFRQRPEDTWRCFFECKRKKQCGQVKSRQPPKLSSLLVRRPEADEQSA